LLLQNKYGNAFKWTLIFYLPILVFCYLLNCYTESITLVASNDFYKTGQTLQYHLRQVNINSLLFVSIIVTTILTAIVNAVKRYRVTKKRQPGKPRQLNYTARQVWRRVGKLSCYAQSKHKGDHVLIVPLYGILVFAAMNDAFVQFGTVFGLPFLWHSIKPFLKNMAGLFFLNEKNPCVINNAIKGI
jgi:hypothetical protein